MEWEAFQCCNCYLSLVEKQRGGGRGGGEQGGHDDFLFLLLMLDILWWSSRLWTQFWGQLSKESVLCLHSGAAAVAQLRAGAFCLNCAGEPPHHPRDFVALTGSNRRKMVTTFLGSKSDPSASRRRLRKRGCNKKLRLARAGVVPGDVNKGTFSKTTQYYSSWVSFLF